MLYTRAFYSDALKLEDTLNTFKEDLTNLDKQTSKAVTAMQTLTNERLKSDDQVMQALSALAPKTLPSSGKGPAIDLATIDKWCQALILLRENEINSQIDASIHNHICEFLETRDADSLSNGPISLENSEAELHALRQEISSVVELVVDSELRKPLKRLLSDTQNHAASSQREWLTYVLHTFEHMVAQLSLITNHVSNLHAFDLALTRIRSELLGTSTTRSTRSDSQSMARPPSQQQQMPSRPTHSRSNSRAISNPASSSLSSTTPLIDQFMKRFSLTDPISTSAVSSSTATNSSISISQSTIPTSLLQLRKQYNAATSTTISTISHSLATQNKQVQLALEQVYAHSPHASIHLFPQKLEKQVEDLDREIQSVVALLGEVESGEKQRLEDVLGRVKG